MAPSKKGNVKSSDLIYPINLRLSGICNINTDIKKLEILKYNSSNIIKRISCLVAMHLSDSQGFTRQTQYLLASQINSMLKFGESTACVNGYTEYPMEDKRLNSYQICRKEHIKFFIDDETTFIISYDLKLYIGTFDEGTNPYCTSTFDEGLYQYNGCFFDECRNQYNRSTFDEDQKVALVPILDDYLIKFFKDLQKQHASIGAFNLKVLSNFMGADVKLYKYPPMIAKLSAALEKPDLNNVE